MEWNYVAEIVTNAFTHMHIECVYVISVYAHRHSKSNRDIHTYSHRRH